MKQRVMVDFDGVIHSYASGWTGAIPTDPPMEGALEFVHWLLDQKYDVVIFTTRAETIEGLRGTAVWLAVHDFPPLKITNEKLPAAAYVDDRAVPFRPAKGFGWDEARTAVTDLTQRR